MPPEITSLHGKFDKTLRSTESHMQIAFG